MPRSTKEKKRIILQAPGFFAMPKEIALAGGGAASENRMSLREGKKHHH